MAQRHAHIYHHICTHRHTMLACTSTHNVHARICLYTYICTHMHACRAHPCTRTHTTHSHTGTSSHIMLTRASTGTVGASRRDTLLRTNEEEGEEEGRPIILFPSSSNDFSSSAPTLLMSFVIFLDHKDMELELNPWVLRIGDVNSSTESV